MDGTGGSHFDPRRSRLVSRSMFAEEYLNPDGTRTVKQATDPLNVKDSTGTWHPVDTGMTADVSAGRVRVKRHPLNPSLAVRGNDTALVSVEVDGKRASLGLEQAAASTAKVAGTKVGYPDVLPDTDLDLCLTTDTDGRQAGDLRTYTPFGEPITPMGTVDPDGVPDNQPGQMDYGWLGQHQRPYEHAGALALIQMGARPYSPLLGRFLSVDPIEGGSANDYDYVAGDPINATDLDGKAPWIPIIIGCIKWCNKVGRIAWRGAKWGYRKILRPSVIWTGNALKSGARELFGLQSRLLGRNKKGVLTEMISFDLDGRGGDPLKLEEMSLDWPSAPGAVCLGSAAEGLLYINT